MEKRSVMAVPIRCFFAVIAVCVIGIIVGSTWDYDINVALANKTELLRHDDYVSYLCDHKYCALPRCQGKAEEDGRVTAAARVCFNKEERHGDACI